MVRPAIQLSQQEVKDLRSRYTEKHVKMAEISVDIDRKLKELNELNIVWAKFRSEPFKTGLQTWSCFAFLASMFDWGTIACQMGVRDRH